MKRKLIIALAAAMTITLGSVGVVSADDANFAPFIPVNETGIRDGFIWVVDKEAWDEQVLVSPEEGHWETVIDKEAWIEKIEHKEEGHYENGKLISPEKGHYETIVDKEAWDEIVHHEEEGHYEKQNVQVGTKPVYEKEMHVICHSCGGIDIGIAMDPIEGGMSQAYAEHRIWHAIEEEIIEHNPVSDVNFKQFTYKPVENQSDNVFSYEETQKLLSYLQGIYEPYSLAIQLSFYLFIRVGETKAIQWQDIDYKNRSVYLHRQVTCARILNDDLTLSKRQVTVAKQMKGNTSKGFRKQYLTDEALSILKKAKEINPNGIYIFEPNGSLMTTDSFNRRLKKYCREAGVPYYSSHKIRFYNASTAYDGKNLTAISHLMGHSKVETTIHYLRNVHKDENPTLAFKNLGLSKKSVQGCSK